MIGDPPQPDLPSGLDPSELKECVLTVDVDDNGHVSRVRVKKSSGNGEFDDACERAIRRARFKPAVQDHIPQSSRYEAYYSPSG